VVFYYHKNKILLVIEAGKEYRKVDGYFNEYDYILSLSGFDNIELINITSSGEYNQEEIEEYYNSIVENSIPDSEEFSLDKYNINEIMPESKLKILFFKIVEKNYLKILIKK